MYQFGNVLGKLLGSAFVIVIVVYGDGPRLEFPVINFDGRMLPLEVIAPLGLCVVEAVAVWWAIQRAKGQIRRERTDVDGPYQGVRLSMSDCRSSETS